MADDNGQTRKFFLCLIATLIVCSLGFGGYYYYQQRLDIEETIAENNKFFSSIPAPKNYKDAYDYYLRYRTSDDNLHTFSTAIRLDEVRNVPFSESMIIKDWESKYSKFFSRN